MDLILDESQTAIRDSVRRYCKDQYGTQPADSHRKARPGLSAHWREWARLGWLGVCLPEAVGGLGGSRLEMALIQEEFGRSLVREPYVACAVLAAQTIVGTGAPEVRTLLEPMLRGEQMLALAHFEQRAGGRVSWVESGARGAGDGSGFILNGSKCAVIDGDIADLFIVSARTHGRAGDPDGISLFIVPRDAPGLTRRDYQSIDGHFASDLRLSDVAVPGCDLLGTEGDGCVALELGVSHAIIAVCAEAVGAMEAVIDMTVDYLKTRRAYGVTLSAHQVLQHRIADMSVELELSRSMLHVALAALDNPEGDRGARAISAAKAFIGASGLTLGASAIQLHGGIGVAEVSRIGHYFKRLTAIAAQFGNNEYHLTRYARYALGADEPAQPGPNLRAVPAALSKVS